MPCGFQILGTFPVKGGYCFWSNTCESFQSNLLVSDTEVRTWQIFNTHFFHFISWFALEKRRKKKKNIFMIKKFDSRHFQDWGFPWAAMPHMNFFCFENFGKGQSNTFIRRCTFDLTWVFQIIHIVLAKHFRIRLLY